MDEATTVAKRKFQRVSISTKAINALVKRAVALEMLSEDTLPAGVVAVTVVCDFGAACDMPRPSGDLSVQERLQNLAARAKLCLRCDDTKGEDIVLVHGDVMNSLN